MGTTAGNRPSMTSEILKALRDEIISNGYSNGQFITEAEISAKFNVSKTPAREALNFLCQEGLLIKIPRKGYMVRSLTVKELQDLFQYRRILECASVEHATRYGTEKDLASLAEIAIRTIDINAPNWKNQYYELNTLFHLSIARISGNEYLINDLGKVLNMLRRDLVEDMQITGVSQALENHVHIVEAMKERNIEKALRITKDNIDIVEHRLYVRY